MLTGYADNDADTYTLAGTSVCSGASLPSPYLLSGSGSVDCNDSCPSCFPGSGASTASPDGLDQDCNGVIDNMFNLGGSCPLNGLRISELAASEDCNQRCGGTGSVSCVSGYWCQDCGGVFRVDQATCTRSGPVNNVGNMCHIGTYTCTCPNFYR